MINALITYLPFYRINEIEEYFMINVNKIKALRNVVYVDNVFNEYQKNILKNHFPKLEIKTCNWNDRNLCYIQILDDMIKEPTDALVVDSDNLLVDNFSKIDDEMCKLGYGFYNVADSSWNNFPNKRSKRIGEINVNGLIFPIFSYKVYGIYNMIFFIGPKQAVKFDKEILKKINVKAMNDIKNSLIRIDQRFRNYISDETTLGFIYYYSGIKNVPWIIGTQHKYHASTPITDKKTFKMIRALTFSKLGRNLIGKSYPRMNWFYVRYKLAYITRTISMLF
ncbi:MAG: hypothetical protein RXO33_03245 [Nitrososphaeria archaeon]